MISHTTDIKFYVRHSIYNFVLFCLIFLLSNCSNPKVIFKSNVEASFYNLYNSQNGSFLFHQRVINESSTGDSYNLSNLRAVIGALNSIICINNNKYFINEQILLIDNIINSARVSSEIRDNKRYNDQYKGWISFNKDKVPHYEVPLYEGYSFFYILQFLYYLEKSNWLDENENNKIWWEDKIDFVVKHVWNKWYNRGVLFNLYEYNPYRYFLRSRTHMASHWAGVALYLERVTGNLEVKNQCRNLYTQYDLLLKRNLHSNPNDSSSYIWNSTFDDVSGTFATKVDQDVIQDVSHGNHVVSYIIAAYELGNKNWEFEDIQMLCNTLKKIVYNKKNKSFYDNVDGSNDLSRKKRIGFYQADGWVKLGKYDPEVYQIHDEFRNNIRILRSYNQELQFLGNFFYISYNRNRLER